MNGSIFLTLLDASFGFSALSSSGSTREVNEEKRGTRVCRWKVEEEGGGGEVQSVHMRV